MTDPQNPREVRLADCYCTGKPHSEGDLFVLPAEFPIRAGIAAASKLMEVGEHGDASGVLIEAILYNGGISAWNLVDDEGKPLRVTPDNVAARVTWQKGGIALSNAVFEQFVNNRDLTPFGLTNSRSSNGASSPNGPTAPSTSAKTRSSPKRPAPTA